MGWHKYASHVLATAEGGDCWARSLVRVEEMRQSLRIIEQCRRHLPAGPVRADHPLAVPPPRERMLHDIETLIHHFLDELRPAKDVDDIDLFGNVEQRRVSLLTQALRNVRIHGNDAVSVGLHVSRNAVAGTQRIAGEPDDCDRLRPP